MAKLKISDYSSTSAGANLNTDINSIDIDEGCAPSGINNAIRTLMAQLKDFQTGVSGDSLTLGGALSGTSATFSGNVTASAISGASMTLSGDLTVDTNTLYVDSTNNRVGIGTSSPSSPLTVSTASGAVGARVISTSSGTLGPDLSLYHNSSSPADNDIISLISFLGNDSGATSTTYSQIRAIANDVTDTTEDGSISILTTSAGTLAERMRITSSGELNVGSSTNYGGLISISRAQTSSVGNMLSLRCQSSGATTSFNYYGDPATGTALRFDYGGAYLAFRSSTNERMRIDSSGNLSVGTTTAIGLITSQVANGGNAFSTKNTSGTAAYNAATFYNNGGSSLVGSIQPSGSTTSYNTSSDYRLKENIAPMTGALDKVAQLKPVTYNWKVDGSNGQGFIAHELAEVVPDAVSGEKDAVNEDGTIKPQGIDTSFLVATLTAAIQELKTENDTLKSQLSALETRIQALENA